MERDFIHRYQITICVSDSDLSIQSILLYSDKIKSMDLKNSQTTSLNGVAKIISVGIIGILVTAKAVS